ELAQLLRKWSTLETVVLIQCKQISQIPIGAHITMLDLTDTGLVAQTFASVEEGDLPSLTHLKLVRCKKLQGVEIAPDTLPNLNILNVSETDIDDAALTQFLLAAPKLSKSLRAEGCSKLRGDGVPLDLLLNIKEISLIGSGITQRFVTALREGALEGKSLQRLFAWGCPRLAHAKRVTPTRIEEGTSSAEPEQIPSLHQQI